MLEINPAIAEGVKKRRVNDPSSTTCQKCGATDTSSFEMAYAAGTSAGTFTASSYTFGGGATVTKGHTTNQSILATRTRPPVRPQMRSALILVALMVLLLAATPLVAMIPRLPGELKFMLFIGIPSGLLAIAYIFERKRHHQQLEQYERSLAAWQRSWICLRCGYAWKRVFTS